MPKPLDVILQRIRDDDPELKSVCLLHIDRVAAKMGDKGAEALSLALFSNSHVQTLRATENDIGDRGAEHIARLLLLNPSVSDLSLAWNRIGDVGISHLSRSLRSDLCGLTWLFLQGNEIGPAGIEVLADALRTNGTLRRLALSHNDVGDSGAASLARALVRNDTLQFLGLNGAGIGDEGAAALACAMQLNTSVKRLQLLSNNIGEKGEMALGRAALRLGGGSDDEELRNIAFGMMRDSSPIRIGLKEIGVVRRRLASWDSPISKNGLFIELFVSNIKYTEESKALGRQIRRTGQSALLGAVLEAGMEWMGNKCECLGDDAIAIMVQAVGRSVGVQGIFGILGRGPEILIANV